MSKTDIGIDLGTANTVITLGKKGVVLSEPSAIAYHTHTKEVLAVGKRAYQMIGKHRIILRSFARCPAASFRTTA